MSTLSGTTEQETRSSLGLLTPLTLGALGVVYGDIGTSPLYTLKECFSGPHALPITEGNVMGVLSLIFWSLIMVVTVKYVVFVTRADNKGEGGTFALLAVAYGAVLRGRNSPFLRSLPYLALISAALLYSDGIITPAISVLSAVEGLNEVAPSLSFAVLPLTCAILALLFLCQKYGTARLGGVFGPVMLLWFCALAAVGVVNMVHHPAILEAVNPWYAWRYFAHNGTHALLVLSTVVLCITGGEALYADLGHFGRLPIKRGWLYVACPALLLNYMGQGALLLQDPTAAANPFYQAVPAAFQAPMLVLATLATVIASQALISGVYSLTCQAIHLGFLPRMRIVHTSRDARGQVYLPTVNTLLMLACICTVLFFQSSSGLAAAYGLAVTGAMSITSLLFYAVTRYVWQWSRAKALGLLILFLCFDLPFVAACGVKLTEGGWLPLLVTALLFTVMATWREGRVLLARRFERMSMPLKAFTQTLNQGRVRRTPGMGVYMTLNRNFAPLPLARTVALMHSAPETIVLLTIQTAKTPLVEPEKRLSVDKEFEDMGVFRMLVCYGYMEQPDMQEVAALSKQGTLSLPLYDCTFYLGRETYVAVQDSMPRWRRELFCYLSRNAWNSATFFNIPPSRVMEIGTQLSL